MASANNPPSVIEIIANAAVATGHQFRRALAAKRVPIMLPLGAGALVTLACPAKYIKRSRSIWLAAGVNRRSAFSTAFKSSGNPSAGLFPDDMFHLINSSESINLIDIDDARSSWCCLQVV